VRGGVQVELRATVQADASRTVLERYLFSRGKLTRTRMPRSAGSP
jgi:hypothetical protein